MDELAYQRWDGERIAQETFFYAASTKRMDSLRPQIICYSCACSSAEERALAAENAYFFSAIASPAAQMIARDPLEMAQRMILGGQSTGSKPQKRLTGKTEQVKSHH